MTNNQKTLALSLSLVCMCPGTATKRFARDMSWAAVHFPDRELTEKQSEYLRTAVIRYRRQLPEAVVALARSMEVANA